MTQEEDECRPILCQTKKAWWSEACPQPVDYSVSDMIKETPTGRAQEGQSPLKMSINDLISKSNFTNHSKNKVRESPVQVTSVPRVPKSVLQKQPVWA